MSLWEERAARNEALFREVNEQVDSLSERARLSALAILRLAEGGLP